jgi:hypothetical protein
MNLVIGDTSQQSYYYPSDYKKISSRSVDLEFLQRNQFDSVYITFAEQRIYESQIDYILFILIPSIEVNTFYLEKYLTQLFIMKKLKWEI